MLTIKDLAVSFRTRRGEVNAVRGVSFTSKETPRRTEKLTPSTARKVPPSVSKWTWRSRTSRSGASV